MLDVSGIGSRSEALRVYYAAVNNDGYKLTQDDLNYLNAKWGIEEEDLDEVEFDVVLDDDDVKDAEKAGKKEARKENVEDCAETGVSAGMTAMSAGFGIAGGVGAGKGLKSFLKGTSGKGGGGGAMAIVALVASLAAAIIHLLAAKDGKDEKMAALQEEMVAVQDTIRENQNEMNIIAEDILSQQEEADASVEAGQGEINDLVADYILHKKDYDDAVAKQKSGQELSPAEQEIINKYAGVATQFDAMIADISDNIEVEQNGYLEAIAGYQTQYDGIGEETLGLVSNTTTAEKVATTAKVTSQTNFIASGVNIASAVLSAARMWIQAPFNWVVNAIGTAIAVAVGIMEGIAMAQENKNIKAADASIVSAGDTTVQVEDAVNQVNVEAEGSQLIYEEVDANSHVEAKEGK